MIPREHLPLTLVTLAMLGLIFLLYREVNGVKTTIAKMSVPVTIQARKATESDNDDDDMFDENDENEAFEIEDKTVYSPEQAPTEPTSAAEASPSPQLKKASKQRPAKPVLP